MSASVPPTLLRAWADGQISLAAVLGAPAEALAAAQELGERCLVLGDRARAEAIFTGLAALDPADPRPAAALATLALERGAPEAALAWVERARRSVPDEPTLVALAARARRALELRARRG